MFVESSYFRHEISWTQSCEITITIVALGRLPRLPKINIQGIILPPFTKYKHCSLILKSLWFPHCSSWPRAVSTFWTRLDFWCQRIWFLCVDDFSPTDIWVWLFVCRDICIFTKHLLLRCYDIPSIPSIHGHIWCDQLEWAIVLSDDVSWLPVFSLNVTLCPWGISSWLLVVRL